MSDLPMRMMRGLLLVCEHLFVHSSAYPVDFRLITGLEENTVPLGDMKCDAVYFSRDDGCTIGFDDCKGMRIDGESYGSERSGIDDAQTVTK